ncbi:unnamed protein product [Rotaria magnacalcarata]|nr:unnamed protein product [Rotaria magnacalcarata]CAF2029156.1 unnamed protein product [Rotaria magnacalcarata]CAF2049136.1 unnamed protein product [Rotaria magnacalcarata]CAF3822297.1 unnamed protein product [Rotaria magnacalcarata]CAF3822574.1 unnamed protein product [Rotaria magnacalcarata]
MLESNSTIFMPISTISNISFTTSNNTIDRLQVSWSPRDPPVLDIFVRTWRGDGHWLIYLLRSIEKCVSRSLYRNIIITFPFNEMSYFQSYLPFFSLPMKLIPSSDVYIKNGPNKGSYYSQMYVKFHAYQYSDADFFIHMDSDTMFKEPISRRDLLDEHNRVYVKRVKFDTMAANFRVWQKPAEKILLESVPYETMTGFPFVFPRDLYENTIRLIEKRHNKPMLAVVRSMRDFIEFTTLGHYLITHMSNNRWVDNDNKSSKVVQSWSWGGFGPTQVAWYECLLRAKDNKMCHLQPSATDLH